THQLGPKEKDKGKDITNHSLCWQPLKQELTSTSQRVTGLVVVWWGALGVCVGGGGLGGIDVDSPKIKEHQRSDRIRGRLPAGRAVVAERKGLLGEDGLVLAVNAITEVIKGLDKGLLNGAENWISTLYRDMQSTVLECLPLLAQIGFSFMILILDGEDQRE
ncbi:HXXXD-type acyl-transferase family protein, partial [Prunus dulcis]